MPLSFESKIPFDIFGNSTTIKADIPDDEPQRKRFNPMASWMNASQVMDEEFSSAPVFGAETFPAQNAAVDTSALPTEFNMGQGFQPNALYGTDMSQQQDPAALGFANMPYDLTGVPSQGGGTSRPMTPEMAPFGSMDVTGGMTADQQMAEEAMAVDQQVTPFDDQWMRDQEAVTSGAVQTTVDKEWLDTGEQYGASAQELQQHQAVISTAAAQHDGTNTVGGRDAMNDPVLRERLGDLTSNPTKRRESYMKRMSAMLLQSFMLELAAKSMGVESRASQFTQQAMKMMEAEIKFDDEERLFQIQKAVFYPGGQYSPPATKQEAFDRAIAAGASVDEAAAMSGHIPADAGFDTYYVEGDNGKIKTIYVPKGSTPPPGSTSASTVAQYNAELTSGGKTSAAVKDVELIISHEEEAKRLRSQGKNQEAKFHENYAKDLRKRLGMTGGLPGSSKSAFWNSLFAPRFKQYYEDQSTGYNSSNSLPFAMVNPDGSKGDKILPTDFFNNWASQYSFDVYEGDKLVTIQGWPSIREDEPIGQPIVPAAALEMLRQNPSPQNIEFFIITYGRDALPKEYE